MKKYATNNKSSRLGALLLFGLFGVSHGFAADLDFAEVPLFLDSRVQPNIFFMIDDSGSMDWEVLKSEGAEDLYTSSAYANSGNLDITPTREDRDEMLESCAGYNVLYYDPTKTYTPWKGVDEDGVPFGDQSITAARNNPYDPDEGTRDLTDDEGYGDPPGYLVWTDADGDNEFDLNECPEPDSPGWDYNNMFVATVSGYGPAEMSDAEKTNFANWYTYYRKREYVLKRAISEVVEDATFRMGLASLHNNGSIRTLVKDIDDISTPVDATAQANKAALLENLFESYSSGGTPLRRGLENVGEYFAGNSSWGSTPILPAGQGGQCQQNFTMLMSDGYWNGGNPSVGDADSDNDTDWDGLASQNNDGKYYSDQSATSNTLADVAMEYYENDLSALNNKVPTSEGVDENDAQHMVTYTVAFGVFGNLAEDWEPSLGDLWPSPTADTPSTLDDMRHAAYNGRGEFLSAGNPEELIAALERTLESIEERSASASAVSVNTGSITGGSLLFQARFDSVDWTGNLVSYPILEDGTLGSATEMEDIPSPDARIILTSNGGVGVPFRWANLSNTQKTALGNDSDVLDYLRGDQSNEEQNGGSFRDRSSLLGDIIGSSPSYVGIPSFFYPDNLESADYSDFRNTWDGDLDSITQAQVNSACSSGYTLKGLLCVSDSDSTQTSCPSGIDFGRTPMVYVGSNDGMLHGFKADPCDTGFGKEIFAFVPNSIFDKLNDLTSPLYEHQYTVDGSPNVVDAFYDGAWHSVLVSGLNAGGQGVFALDVTDPGDFASENGATDNVLWEFTDDDDDGDHSDGNKGENGDKDLGYTFSQPNIVKLANGEWAAVFGNGYNNTVSDGDVGSGTAVLYIVEIDTGELIRKIDTGVNDLSTPNGLSAIAPADVDGDYDIDFIYGGDLEGNLWKFDLDDPDPNNWEVAYSGDPLFTACVDDSCDLTNRQPITVRPQLSFHPTGSGIMVFFGTGTFFLEGDNSPSGTQSFYAIWDKNEATLTSFDKDDLLEQTIESESTVSGYDVRLTSDNEIDWSAHVGWFMDLVNTEGGNTDGKGERQVSNPVLRNDRILFTTVIPDGDACSYGGDGWLMQLNADDGARIEESAIDLNGDGEFTEADKIGEVTIDGETIALYASGKKSEEGIISSPAIISGAGGVFDAVHNSASSGEMDVNKIGTGGNEWRRTSWQRLQ